MTRTTLWRCRETALRHTSTVVARWPTLASCVKRPSPQKRYNLRHRNGKPDSPPPPPNPPLKCCSSWRWRRRCATAFGVAQMGRQHMSRQLTPPRQQQTANLHCRLRHD